MCTLILLIAIIMIPLLLLKHISISREQQGDISDDYQMNIQERLIELAFVLPLIGLVVWYIGIDSMEGTTEIKVNLSGNSQRQLLIMAIAFIGSLVMAKHYLTRDQIRKWLLLHGYEVTEFKWSIFDNPWARDSTGFFDGQSDSQASYKVEVKDANGNQRIAHILWGGYFGLSALSGKVPVELVWNKVHDLEQMRQRAERQ